MQSIRRVVILIVLIAILIIAAALVLFFRKSTEASLNVKNEVVINYEEQKDFYVMPDNLYLIYGEYEGEITSNDICLQLYRLAKTEIPKYYKDLKSAGDKLIGEYYSMNKDYIYESTGIKDSNNFITPISQIQALKTKSNNIVFRSYRALRIEKAVKSDGIVFRLYITYEGNNEIAFTVKLKNIKDGNNCIEILNGDY